MHNEIGNPSNELWDGSHTLSVPLGNSRSHIQRNVSLITPLNETPIWSPVQGAVFVTTTVSLIYEIESGLTWCLQFRILNPPAGRGDAAQFWKDLLVGDLTAGNDCSRRGKRKRDPLMGGWVRRSVGRPPNGTPHPRARFAAGRVRVFQRARLATYRDRCHAERDTSLPQRLPPTVPGPAIGYCVFGSTPHTGVAFKGNLGRVTDDALDDAPTLASGSALATHRTATAGSASRDSSHCIRVTATVLVAVKRTPPEHQQEAWAQAVSPQRAPLPCGLSRGGGAF